MTDLQNRSATFEIESADEEFTILSGRAPVSTIGDYTQEIISYTRGAGRLFCTADGYEPCHNQAEIIESVGYDPEADLENTPHSVFCAHGAGFVVRWEEVDSYKHLDADVSLSAVENIIPKAVRVAKQYSLNDDELEAIMLREFGPIKRKKYSEPKVFGNPKAEKKAKKPIKAQKNLLIIDGYNLIYSCDEFKSIADFNLQKARETLMDLLSSYVAFTKTELVLVFDAYLVKDGVGSDFMHDGYRVVYTKQDETADAFIERMMFELGPDYSIRVITGDRLVQFSAVSSGILRMTAKEFIDDLWRVGNEINAFIQKLTEQR